MGTPEAKSSFGEVRMFSSSNSVVQKKYPQDSECADNIYDTGFYQLEDECKVEKTFILVHTPPDAIIAGQDYFRFTFAELRLYAVPNLLQILEGTATIQASLGSSGIPNASLQNLLQNLHYRSSRIRGKAWLGSTNATYESCFVIKNNNLDESGQIAITVDLKSIFFINAVLLVENDQMWKEFGPYDIHIGNKSSWKENSKCANGPFMDPSDEKNKIEGSWKQGRETWCNMEGQFLTIIAKLSEVESRGIGICSFGIMGTKFVRSPAITAHTSVVVGDTASIIIQKLTSSYRIGYEISENITIKDSASFSWITISTSEAYHTLTLSPSQASDRGLHNIIVQISDNNKLHVTQAAVLNSETIQIEVTGTAPYVEDLVKNFFIDESIDETISVVEGTNKPSSCSFDIPAVLTDLLIISTITLADQTSVTTRYTFNQQKSTYHNLRDQTTVIKTTCCGFASILCKTTSQSITWQDRRPKIEPVPTIPELFTGIQQTWSSSYVLTFNSYALHEMGSFTSIYTPPELELVLSHVAGPRNISWIWQDNGKAASLVGSSDLKMVGTFTNDSGISRSYEWPITIMTPVAPTIPQYVNQATLELQTDTNQVGTTPAVKEGTLTPATAEFQMSSKLKPHLSLTSVRASAVHSPLYIKYEFTGSEAADELINDEGLYIKIILLDGEKKYKTEYIIQVTANRSIAPKFVEEIPEIFQVNSGVAANYELPKVDASPYAMRAIDPITVEIASDLQPYLTFDAGTKTFYWIDDTMSSSIAGRDDLIVIIMLHNEQGNSAEYQTKIEVTKLNSAPTYDIFDANKVYEVTQGESITVTLPTAKDDDKDDEVSVSVKLNPKLQEWITYDNSDGTVVASPGKTTTIGLNRVQIVLDDKKAETNYFLLFSVIEAPAKPKLQPKVEPEQEVETEVEEAEGKDGNPSQSNQNVETVLIEDGQTKQDGLDVLKEVIDPNQQPLKPESGEEKDENEEIDDYYDEDEDPGEPPTTRKTNFDPMTLWAIQERKKKLKTIQESARTDLEGETLQQPTIRKTFVNQVGEITISFDQNMLFEEVFSGFVFQSDTEAKGEAQATQGRRQLENVDLSAFFQLEVKRGSELSAPYSMLGFQINIQDFDETSIKFKIIFENPLSVSQGDRSDTANVYFPEPELLIAKKTGLSLKIGDGEEAEQQIEMDLPRQFPDASFFKDMGDAGNSVKFVSQAAMGANVFLTIILSVSLKAMWNMVHVLQVIIFLPELLDFPPNTLLFINSLNEAIQLEEFKQFIFEATLPEHLSNKISDASSENGEDQEDHPGSEPEEGASSLTIFISLGIFAIALASLIALLILYCLLNACASKVKKCCSFILVKMKKILFFGAFIRYMIEGNLELTWTNLAVLGSIYTGFQTSSEVMQEKDSEYVSIGFIMVITLWLIFSMTFLLCRHKRLEEEEMKEKYGAMYESIKIGRVLPAIYTPVFCLRRFAMVVTLIYLKEYPFCLIYTYLAIYTINFIYLVHAKANEERIMNWLEYMSELSLIGLLYMMLFFVKTNQLDALVVWNAGIAAIVLLGTCFLINFLYLVVTSLRKMCQQGKLKLIRRNNLRKHRLNKFKRQVKEKAVSMNQTAENIYDGLLLNNWEITKFYQKKQPWDEPNEIIAEELDNGPTAPRKSNIDTATQMITEELPISRRFVQPQQTQLQISEDEGNFGDRGEDGRVQEFMFDYDSESIGDVVIEVVPQFVE